MLLNNAKCVLEKHRYISIFFSLLFTELHKTMVFIVALDSTVYILSNIFFHIITHSLCCYESLTRYYQRQVYN